MTAENKSIEVVQLGAPHGVLDLGNTLRRYQETVTYEIDKAAKNLVFYEHAGGYTEAVAERVSRVIAERGSVVDAELEARVDKKAAPGTISRGYDGLAFAEYKSRPCVCPRIFTD